MALADFSVAFVIAVTLTAIFTLGLKRRGPWNRFWVFFTIIFLTSWAGGVWLSALGPPLVGINWLAFVLTGLIFALLLATLTPPLSSTTVELKTSKDAQREAVALFALDWFFWILIGVLLVAIAIRYVI